MRWGGRAAGDQAGRRWASGARKGPGWCGRGREGPGRALPRSPSPNPA